MHNAVTLAREFPGLSPFGAHAVTDLTEHQVHALAAWTRWRQVQEKKAQAQARGGLHLDAADLGG